MRRRTQRSTSSLSAICGTHLGDTKAPASITGRPAWARRSMSSTLVSLGSGCDCLLYHRVCGHEVFVSGRLQSVSCPVRVMKKKITAAIGQFGKCVQGFGLDVASGLQPNLVGL